MSFFILFCFCSLTFLNEHNFEHISVFRKDLIQRININWIDNIRNDRLDHTPIAAIHGRVLYLLGQLNRIHGRHGSIVVDGELLIARVRRLDALQTRVLRAVVKVRDHVDRFVYIREVDESLLFCFVVV
jgi:hypothetical protein